MLSMAAGTVEATGWRGAPVWWPVSLVVFFVALLFVFGFAAKRQKAKPVGARAWWSRPLSPFWRASRLWGGLVGAGIACIIIGIATGREAMAVFGLIVGAAGAAIAVAVYKLTSTRSESLHNS
jgi:hypothetical protein